MAVTFGKLYTLMFARADPDMGPQPVIPAIQHQVSRLYYRTVMLAYIEHYADPMFAHEADGESVHDLIFEHAFRAHAAIQQLSLEEWWAFDFIPRISLSQEDLVELGEMEQPPIAFGPLEKEDAEWVGESWAIP